MEPFDLRLWPNFPADCDALIDQVVIDSRRVTSPNALFVALKGQVHDGHDFIEDAEKRGARFALVKEGYTPPRDLNLTWLFVPDPLTALQEIAHFYRKSKKAKVLAITGSRGKTMVKDLLFTLLSKKYRVCASPESFNSQLGVALSLLQIHSEDEIALIEAGISQMGEMARLAEMIQPDLAILTHIGNTHLSTLHSRENIAREKMQLLLQLPKEGWALHPNDPLVVPKLSSVMAKKFAWDEENKTLPHARFLSLGKNHNLSYEVIFPGGSFQHTLSLGVDYFLHLLNITLKAAWLFGISAGQIAEVLKNFRLEPRQTEIWTSPLGATFINDPYCADPLSVKRSLRHLSYMPGRKIFVFGGLRQQTSHMSEMVASEINSADLHAILLIGKNLSLPIKNTHIFQEESEAIAWLRTHLQREDTVLLLGPYKESLEELAQHFGEALGSNRLIVNLGAIQANLEGFKARLPRQTRMMVMVKAQGYGTDSALLAKFLYRHGIDIVGVAHVDEGIALRRAGISQKIFVLNAALYETSKAVRWDLEVGVSHLDTIHALNREALAQKKRVRIHLHVDTGMTRLGCRPEEALDLAKAIVDSPALIFEGVMTHFASADDKRQNHFTLSQIHTFHKIIHLLEENGLKPSWRHASNTSGMLQFPLPELNMVRLGLGLFGLSPSEDIRSEAHFLRPAISLTSRIAGINHCHRGETISYGRTYTVQKETERIAVIPIGYFDGLHRHYSGKGHVMVRGQPAPLVGTICMDYMMADVTAITDASIGDPVLIFGSDAYGHYISPEAFAKLGQTNAYELITCLGPRVQRIFIYDET